MPHMKIPPLHKGTKNPGLSLADSNFVMKIVTVHDSKFIHDVGNGELIQSLIRKLSLRENLLHYLHSFLEGVEPQHRIGILDNFPCVLDIRVIHICLLSQYYTTPATRTLPLYKYNNNIFGAGMIRKLPQHVINEISAGQVIQRPYNVIKELVENSIDAGASQINVNIQHGGLKLIKIADNGKGIMKEDFPLLCARFATSKIKDFSDMAQLCSFGFRGEALASLSYVSNLTICSKWHQDPVGHSALFKNQQIQGNITDIPMNTGTTITATELFLKLESRRASLNPMQEKKKIYKLLSHFCLHYPQIRFTLVTEKGDEGLPRALGDKPKGQAKMQIFQQITKLSYDKFTYVCASKIGHSVQVQAIMTKINSCKGKTLMLNINNRIVENSQLFKVIQKAYSECYQSIHEQNESFWVYLSLQIDPKLIDCNVHPTKKAVGLFASEETYDQIKQMVLNQIKKDSAIKIITTNTPNQKVLSIQQSFRQKMGMPLIKQHNGKESQTSDVKSKVVYAFQKNRTDSKQLPLTYFSLSQTQILQKINDQQFFKYQFTTCVDKNLEIKKLFADCSYVGCYGLNHILMHYQNKLFMTNIIPFVPAFIASYCQTNKLQIKKVKGSVNMIKQINRFIFKTKLLPNSSEVQKWIQVKENEQLMRNEFGISIQEGRLESYPCLGDIFVECIDQDDKIGWEVAYLLCRVYNAINVGRISKEVEDKFMGEFMAGQFRDQSDALSPFNQKISNFFKNRVIPVLKTNPLRLGNPFDPNNYMKQMLDLKDIYKIFQRC